MGTRGGARIVIKKRLAGRPVEPLISKRPSRGLSGPGIEFLTIGLASALSGIMLAEQGDPEWNEKYGRYVLEELPNGTSGLLKEYPELAAMHDEVRGMLSEKKHMKEINEALIAKYGEKIIVHDSSKKS